VQALVVDVISGDTIAVAFGEQKAPVRYIMVDAPEPGTPEGDAALARNRALVAEQVVYLEPDAVDRDASGVLLRYVFLLNDQFVNLELIRQGSARFTVSPGNTRYEYDLRNAQVEAMVNGAGQWATVTPTPTAGATATVTPTLSPTPDVRYDSGGLGLDRHDWEAAHAETGPNELFAPPQGTVYDQVYDVAFVDAKVAWIDRRWPSGQGAGLADAEALAARLLPADRQFIRTYYPSELVGAAVTVYYSPSLAARFPAELWGEDMPGTCAAVVLVDGETVTRVVVVVRDPATVLAQQPGG
jgi:endonuclease YncB( thermonuclease family)